MSGLWGEWKKKVKKRGKVSTRIWAFKRKWVGGKNRKYRVQLKYIKKNILKKMDKKDKPKLV